MWTTCGRPRHRRIFLGTADSSSKEQIMTIAAETETLDKRSEGLGNAVKKEERSIPPLGSPSR